MPFFIPLLVMLGSGILGFITGYAIGMAVEKALEIIFDDATFLELSDTIRQDHPKFLQAFVIFERVRHGMRILVAVLDDEQDDTMPIISEREMSDAELPDELRRMGEALDKANEEEQWEEITDELRQRLMLTA